MSVPVVLRDVAQGEFDEAFDYYEGQRPGRGVKFVNQVQKVFDRIGANPDLYPLALADIRKAAVPRFPYSVYYRAETARVEVLAVFHYVTQPIHLEGTCLSGCIVTRLRLPRAGQIRDVDRP